MSYEPDRSKSRIIWVDIARAVAMVLVFYRASRCELVSAVGTIADCHIYLPHALVLLTERIVLQTDCQSVEFDH